MKQPARTRRLTKHTESAWLLAGHAEEIAADPSKRMRFCTQAGVDPGAAPYVLQVIREACGSAEEYLAREYGLTPARRMRLRRMYLE